MVRHSQDGLSGWKIVGPSEAKEKIVEIFMRKIEADLDRLKSDVVAVATKTAKNRYYELMPIAEAAATKAVKPQIPGLIKAFESQTPRLIAAALPPAQEWADKRLVANVVRPILDREVAQAKFKAKYGISRAAAGTGSILVLSAVAYLIISKAKRQRSKQP